MIYSVYKHSLVCLTFDRLSQWPDLRRLIAHYALQSAVARLESQLPSPWWAFSCIGRRPFWRGFIETIENGSLEKALAVIWIISKGVAVFAYESAACQVIQLSRNHKWILCRGPYFACPSEAPKISDEGTTWDYNDIRKLKWLDLYRIQCAYVLYASRQKGSPSPGRTRLHKFCGTIRAASQIPWPLLQGLSYWECQCGGPWSATLLSESNDRSNINYHHFTNKQVVIYHPIRGYSYYWYGSAV